MSIAVGDRIPSVNLFHKQDGASQAIDSDSILANGKVLVFALPGAFTRTCSAAHLPGYVVHADALHAAGINHIVCLSVNDAYVMDAWGKEHNVDDRVIMAADGNAEFTRAIGLDVDLSAGGLGLRSQRYAMIINEGVVEYLAVEAPRQFEVSSAEALLAVITGQAAG